ncbi:NTP transferase domain-containing protein [Candidatus Poribacteria bacterium]|nr:NTP transferase domain-containing protein [Candidatus Poribacteria bacterium]
MNFLAIKYGVKFIVKKAVIPIAGYGTRLFPATKAVPKALFPIISQDGFAKPVIQLIIEEALTAGVEEVCLVAQPQQVEPIADYFAGTVADAIREKSELAAQADRLEEIGERLHFAIQAEPQGFGHAIYCARDFAAGEPVIILLGDHLYISESDVSCAKQLTAVYERVGQSVTSLDLCHESELSVNGIVHGNPAIESSRLYTLTQISEKPTADFAQAHLRVEGIPERQYLCNFGIDLLTPLLFDILDYNYKHQVLTHGEIQLRDAMTEMIRQEGMYGYRVAGERYDTGNPQELLRTVYAFGLQSPYREVLVH